MALPSKRIAKLMTHDQPATLDHPAGRRAGRFKPKGRQVDPAALAEVQTLLAEHPRQPDWLLEHLHRLHDRFGYLSAAHLAALAHEMGLSQAAVWEVASFYHHFTLVKAGETPPNPLVVRVCDSLSCALRGSAKLLQDLQQALGSDVRVITAPCMGACHQAPVAAKGLEVIPQADVVSVQDVLDGALPNAYLDGVARFDAYRAADGYRTLQALQQSDLKTNTILTKLNKTALRGLGGAGFPTGRKWGLVRQQPGPRYLAVNADEGEPGTFKDRHYLSTDPHRMLEGMLIAAHVVGVSRAYIYLRDEYPELHRLLAEELAAVRFAGLADHVEIELRRGAGAYICGEESSMIESIEGKRGLPRQRPPYVAEVGLFGRPTLVNNVETLWWVRDIVEQGADWFNDQGQPGHPGPRSYSVSGQVNRPGVVLAPAGVTVSTLIERCGGMRPGHTFKAFLPGGASGGILPASLADVPLDFGGRLQELGCFVGSHAVVVLSDQDDMGEAARNLMRFFMHESCGQCTPCRSGTEKALRLMGAARWDAALLQDLCAVMADASICGLGQAAPNPVLSVLKYFPNEAGGEARA